MAKKWSMADVEGLQRTGNIRGYIDITKKQPAIVKRPKFGNSKITDEHGNVFDSKKEYCRYQELQFLQSIGEISALARQVVYQLSVCKYIADAVYANNAGVTVVEDTKSKHTRTLPVYRLKKKMMSHELGITIKEY